MPHKQADPFYLSARWRAWRNHILRLRGRTCEVCRADLSWPAHAHVDHIQTIAAKPHLAFSEQNVQVLCASCHSRKTAARDGGFGNPQRSEGGCSVDGLPLGGRPHWGG